MKIQLGFFAGLRMFLLFFFGSLGGLGCTHPPTMAIEDKEKEIYFFVDYPGKNFYFSRLNKATAVLLAELNKAKSSIYFTAYQLNRQEIIDALLAAHKHGVKIKMVGDYDERDSLGYETLRKNNIPIVSGNKQGIQHNKFVIIDKQVLFTGSGNFTDNDFMRSTNHFVKIKSKKIIARYLYEFEQMYGGKFGNKKINPATASLVQDSIHGKKVTVYFFPEQNNQALEHILRSIDSATHSIHYMIFSFSQNEIASALIRASHKIPVEGIHDSTFVKGVSQQAPRLFAAGFNENGSVRKNGPQVYQEGSSYTVAGNSHSGGKMHCKTILIDAETDHGIVITGSFNWSKNAMEKNDENLLIAHDPHAARFLLEHYKHQKKMAFVPHERLPWHSGSLSSQHGLVISEIGWGGSYAPTYKKKDVFLELYNRSNQTIDLSHWVIELQNPFRKAQFVFRAKENGNKATSKIAAGSHKLFYFYKEGHFAKIAKNMQGEYLSAYQLPWQDAASLYVRLYDKYMNLNDEAQISINGLSGSYDWKSKKNASMERVDYKNNLQDGKLWTSWQSSTTADVDFPTKMFHSAGKANTAKTPDVFFAKEEKNNIQIFLQSKPVQCSPKKIKVDSMFTPWSYQKNSWGILLSVSHSSANIHTIDFDSGACTSAQGISAAKQLRFFTYNNAQKATVRINEIHYSSNKKKDYIELKILSDGWLDAELLGYSSDGYRQLYKFLPMYYKKGELPIVYLQNQLSQFINSYDQNISTARELKFYSLRKYLSRQDEVFLLRTGTEQKLVDMVYVSNKDKKMYASFKEEMEIISQHPLWKFVPINQEMSKEDVQSFALDTTKLNNNNSYQHASQASGWKFLLQSKSPSF